MGEGGFFSSLVKQDKTYVAAKGGSIWDSTLMHPSPSFNFAIGGRGLSYGRILTLVGPESSGKSYNAIALIATMQKLDPHACAVYISSEYDIPKEKMELLGVDLNRVLCKETNIPSEIFDWIENDVAEEINRGTPIKIIVVDTIKAIRGPKEMNLSSSESHVMGDLSSYLNKAFKLILDTIRSHNILLILVQQVNEEMDELKKRQGNKWAIPNGQALKHASDYIVLLEKVTAKDSKILDDQTKLLNDQFRQVGHRVRFKILKNRTAGADQMGEFDIHYQKGIINAHIEICELAWRVGVVERPNNRSYSYKHHKWTSKQAYLDGLRDDLSVKAEIYNEVLKKA